MENNLGPNAPLPTKKGLEAIRRRNAAVAVTAKKPKATPPLSKLAGTGTTKAAATVKKLIGPVSPLAAGELPPTVASASHVEDDPFADTPVNHVAEHLADPYSRLGSQLRYLRRHLARYRSSRPLLDAIDAIHRGENLHGNVQRLQSALAVLRKGKVADPHLSEHIKAMHDGYNWDTLAHNLDADARLSQHVKAGGKAEEVSHLYANDAEFRKALLRRKDAEDDKEFLAGTGKHTLQLEGQDEIGDVIRKTESPASYLRYVEETWGDRKHHARMSRRKGLYGLISPEGIWHDVGGMYGHSATAQALGFTDAVDAQKAGYMHVASHGANHELVHGHNPQGKYTPLQILRLKRMAADHGATEATIHKIVGGEHREFPVRLSRVGDPELRELHHMRTLTPDPIVADKIQENGWEHDEHTLDLLRGEHPIPPGHHLHLTRHPHTQKIVAWTDEVPMHLQTPVDMQRHREWIEAGDYHGPVHHGPGGVFAVLPVRRQQGAMIEDRGYDNMFQRTHRASPSAAYTHPTNEEAHATAEAAAFPHERPVVRMSMVSRVAKAVGMAGGAYLGHALGGHMGDFAGGIAGSLGASSTPTEGWPMVGAAAGGMIGHALHPYITPLLTRLKNLITRRKQTAGPALSAKTAALLVQAESMVKDRDTSPDTTQPDRMDQTHRESFRGAMKYLGYPEGEDRRNPEALEAWRLNAHPEVHAAATAAKAATELESKRHMFRHFLGVVRKHVGLLQHHGYLPLPPEKPQQESPLVGVQSREGRVNELLKYLRGPQPMLLHTDGNPKLGPDAAEPTPGAMKRIAARDAAGKGKLPKRRKAKDHFQEFK